MGTYTELIFGCEFKKDLPFVIQQIIQYLIDDCGFKSFFTLKEYICNINFGDEYLFNSIINYPFFSTDRWERIFLSSSYYFGVNEPVNKFWFDDISESWRISTRSNIKNYDGEIEHFLDWIKPYISSGSGLNDLYAIVTHEQGIPKLYYLDNLDVTNEENYDELSM